MTHFAFSPPIKMDSPEKFFHQVNSWLHSLSPAEEIPLEISARRLGIDGHIPDNPPIIDLDQWIQASQTHNCPLTSIHLPLRLDLNNERLGREISAVNGWTDLAAYAGISFSRMHLLPPEDEAPIQWEALSLLVDYSKDMGIQTALHSPDSFRSTLLEIIRSQENHQKKQVGYDLCIPCEALTQLKEAEMKDTHILSIRFSQIPKREEIQSTIQDVKQQHPHVTLVLFDLRKCQFP